MTSNKSNKLSLSKFKLGSSSQVGRKPSNLINNFFESKNSEESSPKPSVVKQVLSESFTLSPEHEVEEVKIDSIKSCFNPGPSKAKKTPKNNKTKKTIGKNKKKNVDIRKILKREVAFDDAVQLNSDGTDADELKLAIALSKSLSTETSENPEIGTQEAPKGQQNIKTILEQYGFKCKNNNTDYDLANLLDGSGKPSKFNKRLTKLTLTSDLQRQQILSENIDRVLRENVRENQPPNNQTNRHQIFSYFLKNLEETTKITIEKTKFELDPNLLVNYYVQDLFFPSSVKSGSLLRDWAWIPGWDESPLYKDVGTVDCIEDPESTIVYGSEKGDNSSCSDIFAGCDEVGSFGDEEASGVPTETTEKQAEVSNCNQESSEIILLDSSDEEDVKIKEKGTEMEESPKIPEKERDPEKPDIPESLEIEVREEIPMENSGNLEENPALESQQDSESPEKVEFMDYEDDLLMERDYMTQYELEPVTFEEEPEAVNETLLEIMEEDQNDDLDINMSISHILEATVIPKTRKEQDVIDLSQDDPMNDSFELQSQKPVIESDLFEYRRDLDEPEPDYKSMTSDQLNLELKKFGLKNLPKKKAISILQFIYDEIHPKIKIVAQDKENGFALDDTRNFLNVTDLATDINYKESDGIFKPVLIDGEDVILPGGRKTKKILTCQVPLHIAFYNMVRSNKALEMKILECEKFHLDELLSHFKRLGTPYQESDVVKFLDKRCITYKKLQKNLVKFAKKQFFGGKRRRKN